MQGKCGIMLCLYGNDETTGGAMKRIGKLFMNNRSQTVRLPKEFHSTAAKCTSGRKGATSFCRRGRWIGIPT